MIWFVVVKYKKNNKIYLYKRINHCKKICRSPCYYPRIICERSECGSAGISVLPPYTDCNNRTVVVSHQDRSHFPSSLATAAHPANRPNLTFAVHRRRVDAVFEVQQVLGVTGTGSRVRDRLIAEAVLMVVVVKVVGILERTRHRRRRI